MSFSKDLIYQLSCSHDYKARFVAEYLELDDRIYKLEAMLFKWSSGLLDFTPSCPFDLLNDQCNTMKHYRDILIERAKIENIDLSNLVTFTTPYQITREMILDKLNGAKSIMEIPPESAAHTYQTVRGWTLSNYDVLVEDNYIDVIDRHDAHHTKFYFYELGIKWRFLYE